MIFLTVGHQMPFDRLVQAMDQWAGQRGRDDVFAQIGNGAYKPVNFRWIANLAPDQFAQRMKQSSAVVSHAGTGTIIAALELAKPLLVLPRRGDLGETRNDHQISTAKHFAGGGQILTAYDESELFQSLDKLESFRPSASIDHHASPELIQRLRQFAFSDT